MGLKPLLPSWTSLPLGRIEEISAINSFGDFSFPFQFMVALQTGADFSFLLYWWHFSGAGLSGLLLRMR